MKRLLSLITKISLSPRILSLLVATTIFCVHSPYYYFLLIKSPLLNTYVIARILTIALFTLTSFHPIYVSIRNKLKNQIATLIVTVLFVGSSLSILSVSDIPLFLSNYEDLIFGIMFYFSITIYLLSQKNTFINLIFYALLFSTVVSVIDEFILLLYPHFYINIAKIILPDSQLDFIEANTFRGRLYLNRYNEVLIPILLSVGSLFKIKLIKRLFLYLLVGAILILAVFSGWRIRLLTAILAIGGSIFFLQERIFSIQKLIVRSLTLCLFLLSTYYSSGLMHELTGFSTLGRLTFEQEGDISALTSRLHFFAKAIELFQAHPFVGVGIGHYRITGNSALYKYSSIYRQKEIEAELLAIGPHNIFLHQLAETGILGTIPLILLSVLFVWQDAVYLFQKNHLKILKLKLFLILSFWLLFLFAMFHSQFGFQFYALFFGLRSAIIYMKNLQVSVN